MELFNKSDIVPVFVKEKTLGDTWFQLLWDIYHHGRSYLITSGSYAGAHRLEFDFVSGISMFPHQRPLAPIMPEGIPPTTTDDKIGEYFAGYLMDPELAENEHYKYAQWINGQQFNGYHPNLSPKISTEEASEILEEEDFDSYLKSGMESQLEWVIRHFKTAGFGNNHCFIAVGDKNSCFAYDAPYKNETERRTSPCLRGIDFKIKGGKLISHIIYRSWDLYGGWPENMGGFTLLNEYVADQLGDDVEPGPMAFSCFGLHCYDFQIEPLKAILHKE